MAKMDFELQVKSQIDGLEEIKETIESVCKHSELLSDDIKRLSGCSIGINVCLKEPEKKKFGFLQKCRTVFSEILHPNLKCRRLGHNVIRKNIKVRKPSCMTGVIVEDFMAIQKICKRCGVIIDTEIREKTDWYTSCDMPGEMWDEIRENGFCIIKGR